MILKIKEIYNFHDNSLKDVSQRAQRFEYNQIPL